MVLDTRCIQTKYQSLTLPMFHSCTRVLYSLAGRITVLYYCSMNLP